MCEHHSVTPFEDSGALPTGAAPAVRARKLWDNDPGFNCSIVGTCLSLGELRRIARKLRLGHLDSASEMELHSYFVRAARGEGERKLAARLMQKTLERKFRTTVQRFARARTAEDLRQRWLAAREAGDIPGPYWALMTHPAATQALLDEVFGDVHMLSHLVGASNRADLRRLGELESERDSLAAELASANRRQAERERDVRDLEARLGEANSTARRHEEANRRLRRLEDGSEVVALRDAVAELRRSLDELERRAGAAERRLAEDDGKVAVHAGANQRLEEELHEIRVENEALESELRGWIARDCDGNCEGCEECVDAPAAVDLGGQRVLYVGGRTRMTQHFRALVERCNGRFIHHDGGLEDAQGRLEEILGRADAVLCPMDCISHGASVRAKKFCKRYAKPVIMLRSSGISSFTRGLHEVARGLSTTVTTQ